LNLRKEGLYIYQRPVNSRLRDPACGPEFWSPEFWSPRFFGTLVTNFFGQKTSKNLAPSQKTEYWTLKFWSPRGIMVTKRKKESYLKLISKW